MRRRLLTSITLWLFLGATLAIGGVWAGKLLLIAVAVAVQFELNGLLRRLGWKADFALPAALALILGGFLFAADPTPALSAGLLFITLTHLRRRTPLNLLPALASVGLVAVGLGSLAALESLPLANSLWVAIWVIATVKLADGAAYFFGTHFGRTRINTSVSPLKSYEGLAGALTLGVILGFVGAPLFEATRVGYWLGPVLGAVLALVGSLGDFAESALKRAATVKDSSHTLPGIGGLLDLTDSLIFAAPVAWIILRMTLPV